MYKILFVVCLIMISLEVFAEPRLETPTFFGGSKVDSAKAIGFDSKGNVYVAGVTQSSDLPLRNPIQNRAAESDVFVAKLSPDRKNILYSTYIGGSGKDELRGMSVHPDGHVWLTGVTSSEDFPLRNPIQKKHFRGIDGFVVKLSPKGALLVSSYIGGSGKDDFNSIGVDNHENAYVTGTTLSVDFPTTKIIGISGSAFVLKISPAGQLIYSIRFGGSTAAEGTAVTIDQNGFVYLCGTVSLLPNNLRNFPITSNAFDRSYNGGRDAFVMKLRPDASEILYSSYLGGSDFDIAQHVSVAPTGRIYVGGITSSVNFPIKNFVIQRKNSSFYDVFVTALNSDGSTLAYSTYYSGSRQDNISGLSVDRNGAAYITGTTGSKDLPIVNKIVGTHGLMPNCAEVSYMAKIPAHGNRLAFSSYLGFAGCEGYFPTTIDIQNSGKIFLSGLAYFPNLTSSGDAFLLQIVPTP